MVMTSWFDEEIPFNMAAEIGTQKVITDHSTIGLVVTTDGSISDIPRAEYEECEERVIHELKELGKPFVVILNTTTPDSPETKALADELTDRYDARSSCELPTLTRRTSVTSSGRCCSPSR